MPVQEHWTIVEARRFMPSVPKATISIDSRRFHRWSAFHPREAQPRFSTKSWGPNTGISVHVLSTVWAWHEAETGESCPYQWPTTV